MERLLWSPGGFGGDLHELLQSGYVEVCGRGVGAGG